MPSVTMILSLPSLHLPRLTALAVILIVALEAMLTHLLKNWDSHWPMSSISRYRASLPSLSILTNMPTVQRAAPFCYSETKQQEITNSSATPSGTAVSMPPPASLVADQVPPLPAHGLVCSKTANQGKYNQKVKFLKFIVFNL